jgi:hypothetical protein
MTFEILIETLGTSTFVASGLPNFVGTPDEAETYRQNLQATNGGCYAMQYISGS